MPESGFWYIELASGRNYVVHVKMCDLDMLHVDESAWIATTGNQQLSDFLAKGPRPGDAEIEVMGPGMFPRSLISGLWRWQHDMPVTQ